MLSFIEAARNASVVAGIQVPQKWEAWREELNNGVVALLIAFEGFGCCSVLAFPERSGGAEIHGLSCSNERLRV